MKILFITDSIPPRSIGGAGASVWRIITELHRQGHALTVITTTQEKQYEGFENREGIAVHTIFTAYHERWRAYISLYNPVITRRIKEIVGETQFEVVHADTIHQYISYAVLPILRHHASHVFLTARDFMMVAYGKIHPKTHECGSEYYKIHWWDNVRQAKKRFNPLRNVIIRHYIKNVDQIFSVSKSLADILKLNGVPNAIPLHNGFLIRDILVSKETIDTFRRQQNIENHPVVLFPARVSAAKGVYVAMDAMQHVIQKKSDTILIIAGIDERDRDVLVQYAKKVGIVNSIRLISWMPKETTDVLFTLADVIIVPSLYPDPFPTVNLDAALFKKPVVTTCFGGSKEFVVDGKTGFVANPFDEKLFASRILELLENPAKTHAMGEAAYERLRQEFTVEEQAEKLLRRYRGEFTPPRKTQDE